MHARSKPARLTATLFACALLASPASGQQAPDRSQAPRPGQPPTFQLPPVVKRALANGLPVWVVERHDVPVADVSLVVRAGAGADPLGKAGLASLTSDMLDEGAGPRTALELADAVDFLGADLVTRSSWDASTVSLHVPVARLAEALGLMADVAQRPTFPPQELDRLRGERLSRLLQVRDRPTELGLAAFARAVFGAAHRYGLPQGGTESSLRGLSVDDLRVFHAAAFRPANATLIVVGDVTPEAVLPLLERAFGSWAAPGAGMELPAVATAPPLTRREIVVVDKPGAAQSMIDIGAVGVARSTPDYFPLVVTNTILGGSFTSRLNQDLRETHGYTYGARSAFSMRRSPGPFEAAAPVQTDKTAEAVREFFNELEGIRQPVPAADLEKARNYVALGFPSDFETTRDIAGRLAELAVYGLPESTFSTYVQNVLAVSSADVQRAAARYIQPDKLAVVVVGDRKVIEAPLRALGLGPMRFMTADEILAGSPSPAAPARPGKP